MFDTRILSKIVAFLIFLVWVRERTDTSSMLHIPTREIVIAFVSLLLGMAIGSADARTKLRNYSITTHSLHAFGMSLLLFLAALTCGFILGNLSFANVAIDAGISVVLGFLLCMSHFSFRWEEAGSEDTSLSS